MRLPELRGFDNETSTLLEMENETYVAAPPQFQYSDYGEIALLAVLLMIGAPLNLVSLFRTLRAAGYFDSVFSNPNSKFSMTPRSFSPKRRLSSQTRARECISGRVTSTPEPVVHHRQGAKTNNRLLTFKLHLTCANLLIVFGYGFSQLIWLCTYSWHGGDILCRFIKFLHTFCFYATSNLIASIAIDRLRVTIHVDRPAGKPSARRVSKASALAQTAAHAVWLHRLVWSAWMLAFASSIPQFFLWRTFAPFQPLAPEWHQCVTVWMAMFYSDVTSTHLDTSKLESAAYYERVYGALHLTLVFWIPVSVVAVCYALILTQLHRKIRKSNKDLRHLCKHRRESDAVVFRQRCESMHRASICSAGSQSGNVIESNRDSTAFRDIHPSVGFLMELPIVVSSAQPFICQPLLESFAVVTLTKAKRRTMKTTAWILLAYVACWSPYNILELYRYLIDPEFENVYLQLLSNLIVFNAVVNPLIYGL